MSRHTVDEALGAHDDWASESKWVYVQVRDGLFHGRYFLDEGEGTTYDITQAVPHLRSKYAGWSYSYNLIPCPDPITKPSTESERRKAEPVYSGVLRYFPLALRAVARLSRQGNDKHNPGEPLHWSRDKSTDHGDCIVRHQLEPEAIDSETGETHAVAVAWRALAQLELLEEKRLGIIAGK